MSKLSILVNREHLLSQNYIPQNLTEPAIPFSAPPGDAKRLLVRDAAAAAEELFHRAQKEGLHLWGVSGYRPYTRQRELYEAALVKREKLLKKTGDAPMTAVAPPRSSEHQTGLALDVSCPSENYELEETFALTPEGKWLSTYASHYGFILRYPRGKESITGFPYEPWHIRYVGEPLAPYLSLTGLTLEEYYLL